MPEKATSSLFSLQQGTHSELAALELRQSRNLHRIKAIRDSLAFASQPPIFPISSCDKTKSLNYDAITAENDFESKSFIGDKALKRIDDTLHPKYYGRHEPFENEHINTAVIYDERKSLNRDVSENSSPLKKSVLKNTVSSTHKGAKKSLPFLSSVKEASSQFISEACQEVIEAASFFLSVANEEKNWTKSHRNDEESLGRIAAELYRWSQYAPRLKDVSAVISAQKTKEENITSSFLEVEKTGTHLLFLAEQLELIQERQLNDERLWREKRNKWRTKEEKFKELVVNLQKKLQAERKKNSNTLQTVRVEVLSQEEKRKKESEKFTSMLADANKRIEELSDTCKEQLCKINRLESELQKNINKKESPKNSFSLEVESSRNKDIGMRIHAIEMNEKNNAFKGEEEEESKHFQLSSGLLLNAWEMLKETIVLAKKICPAIEDCEFSDSAMEKIENRRDSNSLCIFVLCKIEQLHKAFERVAIKEQQFVFHLKNIHVVGLEYDKLKYQYKVPEELYDWISYATTQLLQLHESRDRVFNGDMILEQLLNREKFSNLISSNGVFYFIGCAIVSTYGLFINDHTRQWIFLLKSVQDYLLKVGGDDIVISASKASLLTLWMVEFSKNQGRKSLDMVVELLAIIFTPLSCLHLSGVGDNIYEERHWNVIYQIVKSCEECCLGEDETPIFPVLKKNRDKLLRDLRFVLSGSLFSSRWIPFVSLLGLVAHGLDSTDVGNCIEETMNSSEKNMSATINALEERNEFGTLGYLDKLQFVVNIGRAVMLQYHFEASPLEMLHSRYEMCVTALSAMDQTVIPSLLALFRSDFLCEHDKLAFAPSCITSVLNLRLPLFILWSSFPTSDKKIDVLEESQSREKVKSSITFSTEICFFSQSTLQRILNTLLIQREFKHMCFVDSKNRSFYEDEPSQEIKSVLIELLSLQAENRTYRLLIESLLEATNS